MRFDPKNPPSPERLAEVMPVAKAAAHRLFLRFGGTVPENELLSLAQAAAYHAATTWDGRGSLQLYATQRIRWSIIDELRRTNRLRPAPGGAALKQAVRVSTERAMDVSTLPDVRASDPDDLTAATQAVLGRAAVVITVELDAAGALAIPDPHEDVERNADRMRLHRAINALPEHERAVVIRHGYQGETFDEIAAKDGVHRATLYSRFGGVGRRPRRAVDCPPEGTRQPPVSNILPVGTGWHAPRSNIMLQGGHPRLVRRSTISAP